ncbi:MAG: MotA/TolQ/ExbB proton channel family protein [Bacteriovoracaceae bacterium]
MDSASFMGFYLLLTGVFGAIFFGQGKLSTFFEPLSLLFIGCTVISSILLRYRFSELSAVFKTFSKVFFHKKLDYSMLISEITKTAEVGRRDSVYVLDKAKIDDKFFGRGILFAAQNRPVEVISAMMQIEIDTTREKLEKGIQIIEQLASDAKMLGLLGSILRWIQLFQSNVDFNVLGGANFASGALPWFYGALLAGVLMPMASKLKAQMQEEITHKNIALAGTLGIIAGENPEFLGDKLKSFLPPGVKS